MRPGRDHVKKLGLRRLGLAPVARGRSRVYRSPLGGAHGTQKALRPEVTGTLPTGSLLFKLIQRSTITTDAIHAGITHVTGESQ